MKAVIIIVLAISLLISSSSSATSKSIFLLAGQSNMVGRGGTYTPTKNWDKYVPKQCASDPRIIRLNNDSVWEQATEPLHSNIPVQIRSIGVGPGIAFASALLGKDPAIGTIGLVPCAVGGTPISRWGRGKCLYNRLLHRARASLRIVEKCVGEHDAELNLRLHRKMKIVADQLQTCGVDARYIRKLRIQLSSPHVQLRSI